LAVGLVEQQIYGGAIDQWFDKISEGLTEKQRADLKRKFSRIDALAKTGQSIRAKAFDVSEHYRQYWQGTGFKAQLVAPSKASAIRFKEALDEIGHVTSDVIISGPDDREGNEEIDKESKDLVRKYWDKMMGQYKTEDEYNRQIIDASRTRSFSKVQMTRFPLASNQSNRTIYRHRLASFDNACSLGGCGVGISRTGQ
jgi:type I restriction enzyme R subunit